MSEGPALALRGVVRRFADGTVALGGVDLDVPRGQFCVLLGASGAGKSTLLRVVNGLVSMDAGSIHVAGHAMPSGRSRARRGRVATIHQSVDLVPRLSVLDNVLTGVAATAPAWRAFTGLHGTAARRRACALLDAVGLDAGHLYRRASTLSGGQQQRVGIARAFMAQPALVLADEPVASLDPRISADVLALLQRAAREHGATVLCSLHQVELARAFADRVIGLRGGRIAFDCPPDALSVRRLDGLYAADADARAAA